MPHTLLMWTMTYWEINVSIAVVILILWLFYFQMVRVVVVRICVFFLSMLSATQRWSLRVLIMIMALLMRNNGCRVCRDSHYRWLVDQTSYVQRAYVFIGIGEHLLYHLLMLLVGIVGSLLLSQRAIIRYFSSVVWVSHDWHFAHRSLMQCCLTVIKDKLMPWCLLNCLKILLILTVAGACLMFMMALKVQILLVHHTWRRCHIELFIVNLAWR